MKQTCVQMSVNNFPLNIIPPATVTRFAFVYDALVLGLFLSSSLSFRLVCLAVCHTHSSCVMYLCANSLCLGIFGCVLLLFNLWDLIFLAPTSLPLRGISMTCLVKYKSNNFWQVVVFSSHLGDKCIWRLHTSCFATSTLSLYSHNKALIRLWESEQQTVMPILTTWYYKEQHWITC